MSDRFSAAKLVGDQPRRRSAARPARPWQAVDERLVRRDAGLIQLFDPPFDQSALNPGLYQRLCPGRARKRRPIYSWRHLDHHGFRSLGETERAWDLFGLLNPVHHGSTPAQIATYKVEPYVLAADVYATAPHTGRGGWTWYTGSAGWMYRLLLESLVGLKLDGDKLTIRPRLPNAWPGIKIHYRYRDTYYHITIVQDPPASSADTVPRSDDNVLAQTISLVDDRQPHLVEIHCLSVAELRPPNT